MQIPIANSELFATVSVEDFERTNQHKWCLDKKGYARTTLRIDGNRVTTMMHRFIMNLEKGDRQAVDHADHDILNNNRDNLRICTWQQNNQNARKCKKLCSSRFKGVSFHKPTGKWSAYIRNNYGRIHLGLFVDERDAAAAYNAKAIELFGEYACINNIQN